MPETTIRQIHGEEAVQVLYDLAAYAFDPTPPLPKKDDWIGSAGQREGVVYLALFEDGKAMALAASTDMTQNVRGALFGMGGVWAVATHPSARRKGYARRTLAHLLSVMHEKGQPFSGLYPFRESFYERIGYVLFPMWRKVKIAPAALTPLLKHDLDGQVELMLIGDGYDAYRDYLRQMQPRVHGMALIDHGDKAEVQKRNNQWMALARVAGEPVGVMLYNLKGEETRLELRAQRFYYRNSQARYLLLAWLARHIDQAQQIEISLPPFEVPESWLVDLGVVSESNPHAPMARIVDVAKIGGLHTGEGRFTARIADPICPWNDGVWQFETVDGILRVSPADRADCELSIQALTALVYGTHDPGDWGVRGWATPAPEMQTTMRQMFPSRLPYMHEMF